MPEKKDENRVKSMLERMKVLRKVDTDGGETELPADDPWSGLQVSEQPYEEPEREAPRYETEQPRYEPVYTPSYQVVPPAPGDGSVSYVDRFMEVQSLYGAFSMKSIGTDTIYLIEEYMKSLPDSLPAESRRGIIMKIIGASGFDFDALLGDGIDRVNKLNEYASQFSQRTDDYIAQRNVELDTLEAQMSQIRSMIEKRRALHKQQFFVIETEAQRLKGILDFITK